MNTLVRTDSRIISEILAWKGVLGQQPSIPLFNYRQARTKEQGDLRPCHSMWTACLVTQKPAVVPSFSTEDGPRGGAPVRRLVRLHRFFRHTERDAEWKSISSEEIEVSGQDVIVGTTGQDDTTGEAESSLGPRDTEKRA
jgi:hypothetical protein